MIPVCACTSTKLLWNAWSSDEFPNTSKLSSNNLTFRFMEFTRRSLANHDLRIQEEFNLVGHVEGRTRSLSDSPEPLEVAALAISGDKNSGLVVTDLPLNPPDELAPDSCNVVGADNRRVLRVEPCVCPWLGGTTRCCSRAVHIC